MIDHLTILAVTAHPDDEGACGGSLAKYAAEGARACVACATRGDGVDAQIKDPALATRATLGQVRSAELACACEMLGLQPPIFLGHQDGEVDQVPVEAAARALAQIIRDLQPTVVLTHDPLGGYGHPDHIAVSRFATRAVALAADQPIRLFYWAMPRSFMERVPAFRERRADIRGRQLGFVGVPDEEITTQIDIRAWLERKTAALACHRTQFEFDPETGRPKTFASSVPEDQRLALFGYERFIRVGGPPARNGLETDLLAGLR